MVELRLDDVLAEERRIMDGFAPAYDEAVLVNSWVYQRVRQRFVDWLSDKASANGALSAQNVLDAGCATGGTVELLAEKGFRNLTGLDLSGKMIERAKERAIAGARFVEGSIESAPFAAQSFDAIVGVFTVHHLLDPAAFFTMTDRLLKPGGYFFLLEYDAASGVATPTGQGAGARRGAGDLLRAAWRWKNRVALSRLATLVHETNPAHQLLSYEAICNSIPNPGSYEMTRRHCGLMTPILLHELVEESRLDRTVVKVTDALDRKLEQNRPCLFQFVSGQKVTHRTIGSP